MIPKGTQEGQNGTPEGLLGALLGEFDRKSGIAPDASFPKGKPHIFRVQEVLGEAFGTIFGELGFKKWLSKNQVGRKMCSDVPSEAHEEAQRGQDVLQERF